MRKCFGDTKPNDRASIKVLSLCKFVQNICQKGNNRSNYGVVMILRSAISVINYRTLRVWTSRAHRVSKPRRMRKLGKFMFHRSINLYVCQS